MALWPFNRKKKLDESLLPDEVSEYYKGGKNNQNRGSWILAVATMLVTAVLAVVLFFGGRWVFQTIFDNDDENNTQTTEQASDDQVEVKVTEPTDNTDSSSGNTNDSSDVQSDSDSTTPTTDDSSASSEQTPITGGINEIPDTGPGDGGLQ